MNTTETEQETPVITRAHALRTDKFQWGYIKCRLFHLPGVSIVLPDVLMLGGKQKYFFSPKYLLLSLLSYSDGDGVSDYITSSVELIGGVCVKIVFFKRDLVKICTDHSFIYQCAFAPIDGNQMPKPQGMWRQRNDQFELALYHHTNVGGERGIKSSKVLWKSPSSIQGKKQLKNIAYGYFTSIPKIKNNTHLNAIGMSSNGVVHLSLTNSPNIADAIPFEVLEQTVENRTQALKFWVDVEMIAPSHIWMHPIESNPRYYEIVLPEAFRVGIQPNYNIPLNGTTLDLKPEMQKRFDYIIVGNADTKEGLMAPFHEEETKEICKLDTDSNGLEIIDMWQKKKNSDLFTGRNVELAEVKTTLADD